MRRIVFDEVDRLVLDKWDEVSELVSAYEGVRDKIREQLQAVEDELRPWTTEQELELQGHLKDGEFWAYRADWLQESKDQPWAGLVVGGFALDDRVGNQNARLYSCVYCFSGKRRRFNKEVFGATLTRAIGPQQTALWSEDINKSCPLNRYADVDSSRDVVLDGERLTSFVRNQLTELADFIDPVSGAIRAALKPIEPR